MAVDIDNRWRGLASSLRRRWAERVDRDQTAMRIEALLRAHGHPIAFEVFERHFILCEPQVPGVQGDPDIAIVLGDAEFDLFFVAQRERGALSGVSVHESVHDAVRDFLGRAMGGTGGSYVHGSVVHRDL